jgi:hypothetical protein
VECVVFDFCGEISNATPFETDLDASAGECPAARYAISVANSALLWQDRQAGAIPVGQNWSFLTTFEDDQLLTQESVLRQQFFLASNHVNYSATAD